MKNRRTGEHLLGSVLSFQRLAERLSTCSQVTRLDQGEEKEAWTLSDAFSDLEGSFRVFLDVQLPELVDGDLTPEQIWELLLDIGEEFRHILYHLKDTKFYGYLQSD